MKRVPGMGERKIGSYGAQILKAMQEFRAGARATGTTSGVKKASKPSEETRRLIAQGHTLHEIAEIRGRQLGSVVALVADMVESGELDFQPQWVGGEKVEAIEAACASVGSERLRPIKDALPPEITFDEIRLVLAKRRAHPA
jgi:ATP-dependent DNA helicase RecQ